MARRRTKRSVRKRRGGPLVLLVALLLFFAVVVAVERYGLEILGPGPRPATGPAPGPGPADAPVAQAVAEARAALAGIAVRPERRAGYERDDWPHWLDVDGDCLNTREEVLIAESVEPARLTRDRCGVAAGRWLGPYTGKVFTDPRDVDIDHVVALQEAHDSGGHAWNRDRRAAFANDLSDPRTLKAVSSAANRAKGAKGPEDWLPPNVRYVCVYVADWVAIKARWGLAMDAREYEAVANRLADCR